MDIQTGIQAGLETGRAISEVGILAIAAGFFVLASIGQTISNKRMQDKLINRLMEDKNEQGNKWETALDELTAYLKPLSYESRMKQLEILRIIARKEFRFSVERVNNIVHTVRRENNIIDEVATAEKLRRMLANIHSERALYFSNFKYKGSTLECYINPDWVDQVYDVAYREVYVNNKYDRTYANIESVYDSIEIEFNKNLLKK